MKQGTSDLQEMKTSETCPQQLEQLQPCVGKEKKEKFNGIGSKNAAAVVSWCPSPLRCIASVNVPYCPVHSLWFLPFPGARSLTLTHITHSPLYRTALTHHAPHLSHSPSTTHSLSPSLPPKPRNPKTKGDPPPPGLTPSSHASATREPPPQPAVSATTGQPPSFCSQL